MAATKDNTHYLCDNNAGGRNKVDHMNTLLYILFGFISGIFGGMGMGGGTLLIPFLTLFLNVDQKLAQGINLISFLIMALISLPIHYKNGFIKTKGVGFIIFSGIIFSFIGAFLASYIPTRMLRVFFGIFLCLLALFEFVKAIKK